MSKIKQKSSSKGSLKLIQKLINENKEVINSKLSQWIKEEINWVSPLQKDDFSEYRDESFLEIVEGNIEIREKLKDFWPKNGPQWDALGTFGQNGVILVEAKANLPELESSPSAAKSEKSKEQIQNSLNETKKYILAEHMADWSGTYYQYLNRLAHLYFLRVLNNVPTFLVMIYFIGDKTVSGPGTQQEWELAIQKMYKTLGIMESHPLEPYIINLFIHVDELS